MSEEWIIGCDSVVYITDNERAYRYGIRFDIGVEGVARVTYEENVDGRWSEQPLSGVYFTPETLRRIADTMQHVMVLENQE